MDDFDWGEAAIKGFLLMFILLGLLVVGTTIRAGVESKQQRKKEEDERGLHQCSLQAVKEIRLTYMEGRKLCAILIKKK